MRCDCLLASRFAFGGRINRLPRERGDGGWGMPLVNEFSRDLYPLMNVNRSGINFLIVPTTYSPN